MCPILGDSREGLQASPGKVFECLSSVGAPVGKNPALVSSFGEEVVSTKPRPSCRICQHFESSCVFVAGDFGRLETSRFGQFQKIIMMFVPFDLSGASEDQETPGRVDLPVVPI